MLAARGGGGSGGGGSGGGAWRYSVRRQYLAAPQWRTFDDARRMIYDDAR